MNKAYLIQWKSRINGRAGRSTKQFSRAEAEKLASELNIEYPNVLHEVVEASKVTAMPSAHHHAEDSETKLAA